MASSDIIKIGFDYRASLEQFEKDTNGVFDGISSKAGKQKITIQLDAKDDKVIDKIKELQKLKLDKFTFEFGNSGLKEQLQTFDKLENKINEIINLGKGKSIIDSSSTIKEIDKINKSLNKTSEILNKSFSTKNKTEAFNQLKEASVAYEKFYGNEKAMATQEGTQAAYNYYKAYEEALKKGVAQTRLEKVTIDVEKGYNFNSSDLSSRRIKEFENYQKYGGDLSDLSLEIASLDGKLKDFSSAYAEVKKNLGEAPITPEIISNIEHYVELLDNVRYLKSWNKSDDKDIIAQDESSAKYFLDSAIYKAQEQNYNYTDSLKTQEIQAIATAEAEKKLAETQKEVSFTSSETNISLGDVSSQTKVSDIVTDQIVANEKKKQESYKATADSVVYHAGVLSKLNKAETNGRFYGSNRGTGYFGTGHYFVDSNSKHYLDNSSTYSKLPYSSVDISQYDNLFKANNDTVARNLHEFLKNITRYTQGETKFNTSELFSQFENVFGNTVMDIKDFESRINGLKDFMTNSSLSDRSDSVSTQFMKSLGYGGVDTRGTKFADTEYGTVIYDLKEESVLQANITDKLQKQGQMLEKINYEKGQVFDSSEDSRLQDIINQQEKGKAIREEYNKIYDDTKLNSYSTELSEINKKLDENDEIIGNCRLGIESAEKEAQQFAKEMKELGIEMSNEEIQNSATESKKSYQERIDELEKERPLLEARRQELESNLDVESKLSKAAMERATATVEDQMKDAFPKTDSSATNASTSAIKEENNALGQTAQSAEKAANSKKKFAKANQEVKDSANASVDSIKEENNAFDQNKWDKNVEAIQKYMDAVTELNNLKAKDKGTGKNASVIADQEQEVERLKNIAYEAKKTLSSIANSNKADVNTWEKWVNVMKQFDQASQGSTRSIARLEDAMRNANNSQIEYMNSVIKRFQNSYDKYSTDASRNGYNPSVEFSDKLSSFNSSLNDLKNLSSSISNGEFVKQEQIDSFKRLTQNAEEAQKALKNMSASEKGMKSVSVQKEIDKINQLLRENTRYSKEAKIELRSLITQLMSGDPTVNLEAIHTKVMEIKNAEELAGRAGKNFFDILASKSYYGFIGQMQSYLSMYVGFYGMMNSIKGISSAVIQLNSDITELSKVSSATSDQIYDDFSSYADIAKDIGGTISDTISATADWSRNGYSIPDSKELARVALLYKNVGDGIDIDSANKSLISTLRGFEMEANEAEKIIDIYNNVSNNEPIDSGGIGEAMQRSAASFNAANTSLQESVALISTTNSVVQNPEKVGNMWKVVSMRIRSATAELEEAGEDTDGVVKSTADLQKMIKSMTGYDILEKDGKTFKSIYNIVLNISKVWNKLSDTNQSALLQALAGKQQSNALSAALSNTKLLEKSYQEAMNSAGSAAEEEKKYQTSIKYSIEQNKAKLEELSNDFLSSDLLKGVIDACGKFIDILDVIISKLHLIPTLLGGIGAGIAIKNVGEHYIVPVSI